jgi:YD repeat-containing protein
MAQSFTATEAGALAKTAEGAKRHVLVTGAAGRIGSFFAEHARDKYALRLMVGGQTTKFTWDDEDRLTSQTFPDGRTDTYAYTKQCPSGHTLSPRRSENATAPCLPTRGVMP